MEMSNNNFQDVEHGSVQNSRRKGMVIILCVCVCVCKILVKLRTLVAPTSYWQTSNYTRIKNNKRLLLKS